MTSATTFVVAEWQTPISVFLSAKSSINNNLKKCVVPRRRPPGKPIQQALKISAFTQNFQILLNLHIVDVVFKSICQSKQDDKERHHPRWIGEA